MHIARASWSMLIMNLTALQPNAMHDDILRERNICYCDRSAGGERDHHVVMEWFDCG